jgi:acylphosphatase
MRVQVSLRAQTEGQLEIVPLSFSFFSLHFRRNHRNLKIIMQVRVHVLVSGIVQGVGFRYFVYHKAIDLDLAGYVRNLFSGDVEIEAEGDRSLVEEFIEQVKAGPRAAHVTDVKIEWIKCTAAQSHFEVQ